MVKSMEEVNTYLKMDHIIKEILLMISVKVQECILIRVKRFIKEFGARIDYKKTIQIYDQNFNNYILNIIYY